MRALLEASIKVFIVAHRFDFPESFSEHAADSSLFLRANRSDDGSRSSKLVAMQPLPTGAAEHLYYRLGAWLADDHMATSRSLRAHGIRDNETTGGP